MSNLTIYKITNSIDDKLYIGKTTGFLIDRYNQHIMSANRGVKLKLYRHMRFIGIRNFNITALEVAHEPTQDDMDYLEYKYMDMFKPELNIQKTSVKKIGKKQYKKNWRKQNIDTMKYYCDICEIAFAERNLLHHHREGDYHKSMIVEKSVFNVEVGLQFLRE